MDWIKRAKELRAQGLSYAKIGATIGKPPSTVYCYLNLERMKTYKQTHKKGACIWRQEHKKAIHLYNAEYKQEHAEEVGLWHQNHKEEACIWRREHKKEKGIYDAEYRSNHRGQYNAIAAKRRALIAGVTIGNLIEIKEIYRRAKEDPKIRCYLCGKMTKIGHRHIDHIIPLSKGGQHRASNLAIACDKCNLSKHDKMPQEIGLLL